MARDVQNTFYDIVSLGAMEQAQAVDYVKKLMTKGRLLLDGGARPPTLLRRSCPTSCNHTPHSLLPSPVVLPGAARRQAQNRGCSQPKPCLRVTQGRLRVTG